MDVKKYHDIFLDIWKFMKKWLTDPRLLHDLTAWDEVVAEANSIVEKHGNNQFCVDMMALVIGEVEKVRMEEFNR